MTPPKDKKNLIGKTTQSFIEAWVKEQVYGRRKDFSSKYTEKGLQVENDSIDFVAQYLNLGMSFKNERNFENDYIIGTPDILIKDCVIDVKNSWDCFTFPLLDEEVPNSDYYWQLQGYMALTGMPSSKLIYTLMDAPQRLIDDEIRRQSWKMGFIDIPFEFEMEIYKRMTFPDVPEALKIKIFEVPRNEEAIASIYSQVEKCRNYISEIVKFKN